MNPEPWLRPYTSRRSLLKTAATAALTVPLLAACVTTGKKDDTGNSVGTGEKRPVVHGDQLAIATVMSVTLTCDHRVVDGAIGVRFLNAFKAMIEEPLTMLA